ncbi:hypothetical protein BCF11_4234 [Collimonas sp. PA-H2]|nr:DUF6678 family protein [Collimonas sp. PA-H2]PFH11776.1 hypothetical protein BCF11_4234 [Collimonas sp. PA-H2]
MNETKWNELRRAMCKLGQASPKWRILDVQSDHLSGWDSEWFYHFPLGGYKTIRWVEIAVDSAAQRKILLDLLVPMHVPGEQTDIGFRIFGYGELGAAISYL